MWREQACFVLSKRGQAVDAANLQRLIIRRFAGVMEYADFDNTTMDRIVYFAKVNVAAFIHACSTGNFEELTAA